MGTTTAILVFLAALGLTPREESTSEQVDLIELNHCYDEHGKLVIEQIIYYDWSYAESRYQVRAWRLLKTPGQIPRRSSSGDGYVAVWQDGNLLRKIHAKQFRETWTQHDPELTEREFLPKEKRLDLRKVATNRWDSPPSPVAVPSASAIVENEYRAP